MLPVKKTQFFYLNERERQLREAILFLFETILIFLFYAIIYFIENLFLFILYILTAIFVVKFFSKFTISNNKPFLL